MELGRLEGLLDAYYGGDAAANPRVKNDIGKWGPAAVVHSRCERSETPQC